MARAENPGTADGPSDDNRILLLGYKPDGRVIVARNNPDRADCVVVLVPGIGALRDLDRHLHRAEVFYRSLASAPDDDTVSVITWLDYEPPGSGSEARDPASALRGAGALASFVAGVHVTREFSGMASPRARLTVIGHGYGGLVTGFAARDHGLEADALVFLGCASAGTETAGELRTMAPVYATSPEINGDGTPYGVHGPRPDSPGFGARVLHPGPLSHGDDPTVRYLPSVRRIVLGSA
ncbi:alpha/beta hydrolase [Streptomyces sp. V3I7]|uniref:alpha/beta hydrolase n=1 Tax=Streptomyces sp. V3I7 TaxID=3042278 RepID=UPI0027882066|nr:alpha/beta hydrolase [Streptomyces sp. V3I7]MDQ0989625.1 pimeloyl-ACP methyl ester carboxylesterase [Streptomyces sp. V3I7]